MSRATPSTCAYTISVREPMKCGVAFSEVGSVPPCCCEADCDETDRQTVST